MDNFSKTRYYTATVLAIFIFFVVGINIGYSNRSEVEKVVGISGKEPIASVTADFSPFWKAWNEINEKYPGATEIDDKEKIYGAIQGLVGSLNDPYSVYFDPEETKSFEDEISGNFTGVGMEVGIKDDILTVIAPLKDTPAYRANIKAGDKILKIDDKVTTGMSVETAVKLIRGEAGTTVVLTMLRGESQDPEEIKVVRAVIDIPTLDTELRKDGIFVIKLYSFSANSTSLFRKAIKKFVDSGRDKLLLDLRGNPGGYLSAAVDMASWFVKSGSVVVTEDYGNDKETETFRSKGYDIFNDKLKFVILIDEGSASASEILAGAMQDHKLAKLVGTKSFGKGSVQEIVKITPDTLLKITVAKWLTPNGTSISDKGLTPDFTVEISKEDTAAKKDPQMDKAVELLLNWK